MTNTFEHTFNINETCQLRITGMWQKVNSEIEYTIDCVECSFGGKIWSNIPYSVLEWCGGMDKVEQVAYNYILKSCVNGDAPDVTTDLRQEHIVQLKNELS